MNKARKRSMNNDSSSSSLIKKYFKKRPKTATPPESEELEATPNVSPKPIAEISTQQSVDQEKTLEKSKSRALLKDKYKKSYDDLLLKYTKLKQQYSEVVQLNIKNIKNGIKVDNIKKELAPKKESYDIVSIHVFCL